MIYFYHGTDTEKVRVKANELFNSLKNKKPNASFFRIDSENFNINLIDEYISSQGLFSNKYVIYLDRLCEKKDIKEILLKKIKEIKESENIFIIVENKLDKISINKIEKNSEKTISFDLKEKDNSLKEVNIFDIADFFAKKKKKEMWVFYRELIDMGKTPEEIEGIIFWKIKTMIIYNNFSNWKETDIYNFMDSLITMYHDSRREKIELETGLESLILLL